MSVDEHTLFRFFHCTGKETCEWADIADAEIDWTDEIGVSHGTDDDGEPVRFAPFPCPECGSSVTVETRSLHELFTSMQAGLDEFRRDCEWLVEQKPEMRERVGRMYEEAMQEHIERMEALRAKLATG